METLPHPQPSRRPPVMVWVAMTVVIFFLALSAADSVGFVPYYIDGTPPASKSADPTTSVSPNSIDRAAISVVTDFAQLSGESLTLSGDGRFLPPRATLSSDSANAQRPVHMTIGAIELDLAVQNPSTVEIKALDALLSKGPARYRDSAQLGEDGNIIIFAHSSHLPIVHNQMYKAFNRVPELKSGDLITLTGEDGTKYLYRVREVKRADVNDNVEISLAKTGRTLTLVTCDTLTGKSARYVLEAEFVGTSV